MVILYKKWKKYNEIQLTKNKMDLNIWKMTNRPPSPVNHLICTTPDTEQIVISILHYLIIQKLKTVICTK